MTEPRLAEQRSGSDRAGAASPRQILLATAAALAVAVGILVVAVLPAEYGLDPLGTGRLLGLDALSTAQPTAIVSQPAGYKTDTREFVLGPYESVEYKYRIEKGGSMVYSWQATGPVAYDFHSEPDGAPKGYAESFDKQERADGHGTYTAPFSGIHGWYWENARLAEVRISLTSAGFYSGAREFFDGGTVDHPVTGLTGSAPAPTR
jgi:hypothetical protein